MSELSDRDWLKHKWAWVEALVQDQPTRGLAHDIGFLLARRYLHADKGRYAWASLKTWVKELGVARTSVLRAFDKLIGGGWLVCEAGGKGAGDSNHYYLPERIPVPVKGSADATLHEPNKGSVHAQKGSRPRTIRVASTHNKGSVGATQVSYKVKERGRRGGDPPLRGNSPPIPRRRILSEELPQDADGSSTATRRQPSGDGTARQGGQQPEGKATQRQPGKEGTATRRERVVPFRPRPANPGTTTTRQQPGGAGEPFPERWVLGNAELAMAHLAAGWDLPKAEEEFDKFRDRAADKGWKSNNWAAAWKTWCRRGRDYETKHPQKARVFGAGIRDWLEDERKRTKH